MVAAKKGNVGIVRKLIQHGASLKLTNKVLSQASFQTICTVTQQVQSVHACSLDDFSTSTNTKVGWWQLWTFQHPWLYHEHLKFIKVTIDTCLCYFVAISLICYTALMNRKSSRHLPSGRHAGIFIAFLSSNFTMFSWNGAKFLSFNAIIPCFIIHALCSMDTQLLI